MQQVLAGQENARNPVLPSGKGGRDGIRACATRGNETCAELVVVLCVGDRGVSAGLFVVDRNACDVLMSGDGIRQEQRAAPRHHEDVLDRFGVQPFDDVIRDSNHVTSSFVALVQFVGGKCSLSWTTALRLGHGNMRAVFATQDCETLL